MKKFFNICFLLAFMSITLTTNAQGHHHGGKLNKEEWLQKMKEFKHGFLIEELGLSEQQSEDFFAVYDAKEEERSAAERKLRKMEREISKKIENGNATDDEIDECIDAQYEYNSKMAEIDKKYEKQFRNFLTKEQLFKLPRAERKFMRTLMERRHKSHPPKPHDSNPL